MDELKRLKLALKTSNSLAYEWNVEDDTIKWSGDTLSVLSIDDPKKISSKKDFTNLIHKDDRVKFLSSLEHCLEVGGDYSKIYRICPQGEENENTFIQVFDKGSFVNSGKEKTLIGTVSSNVNTALYSYIETSKQLGTDNVITTNVGFFPGGEYFNSEFFEELEQAFEENKKSPKDYILLKISIDNLSMMMTWYSMEFAERIMSALEVSLAKIIRKDNVIKRVSVDQFGVILKNHATGEAELVIDRVLKLIQLYNNPSFEEPVHLRTSIGSVNFKNAEGPEDALNKAYLALNSVRNKSSEFYADYQEAKKENMDSKDQMLQFHYMQNAFREERMQIAYQPIVEAKTGKVHSYESLLRVKDKNGELSSAGLLIPIAEKMGIVGMVDQFVLERVVEELKTSKDIILGFNVSNITTDNAKWLKRCTKLLQDPDVASRAVIEITETAAQRDMRQTAYFVAALQALGCKVALDDFGAGYTSFRQLKSLSVDVVKIDGIYVRDLAENSENVLFIKTLIDFNHSYGVETIAECVETGEDAKILMELGVDYMQGFYFGKPDIARPWANERESIESQN